MKHFPDSITMINRAEGIGERVGDIVIGKHTVILRKTGEALDAYEAFDANTATYYDFLRDEALNPYHVPAAPQPRMHSGAPNGEYVDRLDSYSAETSLDVVRPARRLRQRVTTIGAPLVGYAGVEVATGSPVEAGYGLVAGLVVAAVHRGAEHLRQNQRINREILSLEAAIKNPDKTISLPEYTPPTVLRPTSSLLSSMQIESVGMQTVRYNVGDVLNWLKHNLEQSQLYHRLIGPDKFYDAKTSFDSSGIVVEPNTSLWNLYARSREGLSLHSKAEILRTAENFMGLRQKLAAEANVDLQPEVPDFSNHVLFAHAEDFIDDIQAMTTTEQWMDARVGYIQLPPAQVVQQLLRQATNPDDLWNDIMPELRNLEHIDTEQMAIRRELADIRRFEATTNIRSLRDRELRARHDDKLRVLDDAQYVGTLGIVAAAIRQERVAHYAAMREELLASDGCISEAGDQFDAIRLFDTGVNALTQVMEPDSFEAIQTGHRLHRYLKEVGPQLDGTQNRYDIAFQGMREQFPELRLG